MADIDRQRADQIRESLQDAVVACAERGLYQSAKWSVATHLDINMMKVS